MSSNSKGFTRGVRLNKPQDVRRLLSRLINLTLKKDLDVDVLRGITYSCSMVLKSLEVGELADRLERLEQAMGKK